MKWDEILIYFLRVDCYQLDNSLNYDLQCNHYNIISVFQFCLDCSILLSHACTRMFKNFELVEKSFNVW